MHEISTSRPDSPSRLPGKHSLRALWNQFRRRAWRCREVCATDLSLIPAKCVWCGGPVYISPRTLTSRASACCQAVRCSWRWIAP